MSLGDLSIGIKLRLDSRELDGKLELSRAQLRKFAADMSSAASASAGAFSAAHTALKSVSSQLAELRNALLGYFSIMQAARGTAAIVEAASAMQQLSARLKIATADARDFAAAQAGVFEIANRYGASVDETARAFARLNPVIRQMGGGSAETLKMLDGLAASLKLSGATAAETSAVLIQFSQAMGSGKVGGDELRSMMENAEPLMRAVAEQMGKTTGELRQMAEQGQLTSAAFGNALIPAIEKLSSQAGQVPLGLSQSMQVLRNEFSRAFGREFESQSTALSEAIRGIAAHADTAARAVRVLADALAFIVQKASILISGAALGGLMMALGGVAGAARVAMSALSAFNTVAAGLVMGSVMQRLETLSRAGRMGLLGMVFFGAYELTDWLINLANAREKITDLLTPVFRLVDKMRGIDREAEAAAAVSAAYEKARQATAAPPKRLSDPSAFARLTQDLAYETRLRAKHKQELLQLEQAYQDKLATLKDEKARAAFSREYQEARRELILKQKQEMDGILSRKMGAVTRLPQLVESFDAELAALKAHLKTAEDTLEAAFRARLVKEEAYWQAKGEMQRRALDLEAQDLQRQMADQQRLLDALAKTKPKDANQRQEIEERLQQASNRLAELQVRMGEIDGRRMVVDLEVRTNLDRVRQELEDLKASVRERIAEATGGMTPEMRRAAIERANREMLAKMAGDAEGEALVRRMIDVEAAKAEMADLESAWRLALETMRNAEQSANIQREQGLLTTAEAQARIAEAHRQAAAELDAILPRIDAVAKTLGPQAQAQVAAFRNELMQVGQVVDPIAASLNTTFKDAFATLFEKIGTGAKTAKEAFLDFARSVIAAIQRILAQRLAEQIFGAMGGGGGGLGAVVSGVFKMLGFARGGYVTGPGTSTSDSIPARLSAGEYVIRAEAVRRVGVAFLDAINGSMLPPAWSAGRLAFAAGGMVPAVAQPAQQQQPIRIVNAVDPELARDYLESPAGERVLVNVITRNAQAIRNILGG